MTAVAIYFFALAFLTAIARPRLTGSDVWRRATWAERREWGWDWDDRHDVGEEG